MKHTSPFAAALLSLAFAAGLAAGDRSAAQQTPDPRIVGGHEAVPFSWPFIAAIVSAGAPTNYEGQFCGAALVRPDWVVTAAHCFFGSGTSPEDIKVVLGAHDLSINDGTRFDATQILLHPDYDPNSNDSDVALIRLATAANLRPITLNAPFVSPELSDHLLATAIGWGNTSATGDVFPTRLQQADVPIVPNAVCNAPQSYGGSITPNMLCAGYASGGIDSCQGDSGGPLVVPDAAVPGGYRQEGVVSFGIGCAQPDLYGVYARTSNFAYWVSQNICGPSEIPSSTVLSADVNGPTVSLAWTDSFAAGPVSYRLYYAPFPGAFPIGVIDLGSATEISVDLPVGTAFYLAVQPRNGNCLGAISNIAFFSVS